MSWPKRKRTWRSAKAYARGLLLPGLGKSMQRIAHSVDLPEGEIKRFVSASPWNHDRVQEHLVKGIPRDLASRLGAFVVDDVRIVKQGRHSVGAYRQYSGALGKVGNCQVAVNLVYSVPGERVNADQKTWPWGRNCTFRENGPKATISWNCGRRFTFRATSAFERSHRLRST